MMVQCPHCQQGQQLVAPPTTNVLKCNACRRSFTLEAPRASDEHEDAVPTGEQELPPAAEENPVQAVERTLIVPVPTERPQERAPRAKTGELKAVSAPKRAERRASTKEFASTLPSPPVPLGVSQEPTGPEVLTTLPGGPRLDEDAVPTGAEVLSTLPGTHREQPVPPRSDDRTIMVPMPQAPSEESASRPAPARQEAKEVARAPVRPEKEKAPAPRRPTSSNLEALPSGGPGARKAVAAVPAEARKPTPAPEPELPFDLPPPEPSAELPFEDPPEPAPEPEPVAISTSQDNLKLTEGMKLGGYQLIRKIGVGGMGTVWLARQLSLDRDVAVKVLKQSLARDPQFVYRFTQEAFSAAQLIHHNIVQIYDCGSDKQIHFFSMEYVDAESLLSLVEREGRLDPEVAAGYVLQAARGLKFAHEREMVHRDIKPDNLLLNRNGIVKVADMGLVKRSAHRRPLGMQEPLTAVGANPLEFAMGTPAYIAPEQVQNSSKVDARADIYSLGCTLYHLLTGNHPFEGENVASVMLMHVNKPPVPPDEVVRRVPSALSDIVMRMMAKRPQDRYQDTGEVIRALEAFLGLEGANSFSPREEHANLLERCLQGFNAGAWGWRRRWLVLLLSFLAALATVLTTYRFGTTLGMTVAAFAACSWMASFTVRGLFQKGSLFLRFRQLIFQAPLLTWLVWVLLLGGGAYALSHYQLLVHAAAVLGGALAFALGFYVLVDRKVAAERAPFIEEVEGMLRSMRLRGLEEGALRQFVCKYSGEYWEAFYEALFGIDAKLFARARWGRNDRGLPRPKHGAWREPLIRWMDALQNSRQMRRERRQLRMLERKKAKAAA